MSHLSADYRFQKKTDIIIDELHDQYDIDKTYALVSGGHDSDTALDVAAKHPGLDLDGVVHINTGVGIPETREFVMQRCEDLGLKFIEIGGVDMASRMRRGKGQSLHGQINDEPYPDPEYEFYALRRESEEYRTLVTKFGFPGQAVHKYMYANLKEKPLQRFVAMHDDDETIAFVSGVREDESQNRIENIDDTGIQETIGAVWVAPIMAWTDKHVHEYRDEESLDDNPVVNKMHMSGECLCGAYADRRELEMLKLFYPNTARFIENVELDVFREIERGNIPDEYGLWAHGGLSDAEHSARVDSQQTSFTLCSDCEDRCDADTYSRDGNPLSHAEASLRNEWWNESNPDYYCPTCEYVVDDAKTHRETVHPFDDESDWSAFQIDPIESSRHDTIITETSDDVATHCATRHDWVADGPVHRCTKCGAYNLAAGDTPFEDLRAPSDEHGFENTPEPSPDTTSRETDRTLAEFTN